MKVPPSLKTVAMCGSFVTETESGALQILRALHIPNPGMDKRDIATGLKNEFIAKDIEENDCYACD